MANVLDQLPALLGVVIGAIGAIVATAVNDRIRWNRGQVTRWDERRLDACAEYAQAVKHLAFLSFRISAAFRPGATSQPLDREDGEAKLAEAEGVRARTWETLLLLGDPSTVQMARDWRAAVRSLELMARGLEEIQGWYEAAERADVLRAQFYAAVSSSTHGQPLRRPWFCSGAGRFVGDGNAVLRPFLRCEAAARHGACRLGGCGVQVVQAGEVPEDESAVEPGADEDVGPR
jgi:hypothetical protein